MALRQVPSSVLRDMGKRRRPDDELAERIAAAALLEHLLRCGWRLERPAPAGAPPAGCRGTAGWVMCRSPAGTPRSRVRAVRKRGEKASRCVTRTARPHACPA